ncbi:hypothetical protein DOTSEDRAFT_69042 [Dothistroma septosporum NZE10]|uniref:Uncharacterized protein n=1 Tax=Dothistroma septosporum (strain NZE10 / CBS 128990) TaxID=675120 RepID=N1Q3L5_DOTSN|nr:hypothetical protein DOTSEDRAFT_69042 [Dothistroma septosporum NZE10]
MSLPYPLTNAQLSCHRNVRSRPGPIDILKIFLTSLSELYACHARKDHGPNQSVRFVGHKEYHGNHFTTGERQRRAPNFVCVNAAACAVWSTLCCDRHPHMWSRRDGTTIAVPLRKT